MRGSGRDVYVYIQTELQPQPGEHRVGGLYMRPGGLV